MSKRELQNPHKHHSALSCLRLQAPSHSHKQLRHHSGSSSVPADPPQLDAHTSLLLLGQHPFS